MKKKVTYIISDVNRAIAFEWVAEYLDKDRFELDFVIINPGTSILEEHLIKYNHMVRRITCAGKKDWPKAWIQLYFYLRRHKPQIVHCHLQQANILGLSTAKFAGISTRIYTRHHSSLHHVYFPKGVFWDKMANRQSTKIVAISNIVKKILVEWEKVPERKIVLIPHGFLLDAFAHPDPNKVQTLKEKYNLGGAYPVIGVISRFTEWKGVQYIIPAFKKLLSPYPDAVLLLFNADGDYAAEISKLLSEIPERNYRRVTFEPDIAAAYQLMDVFVHTPIDEHSEAFGQIYIESLAAGTPMVSTLSGIGSDILEHKKNAWVVPYKDTESIAEGINFILSDKDLREKLIETGKITAEAFSLQHMIDKLNNLYATA